MNWYKINFSRLGMQIAFPMLRAIPEYVAWIRAFAVPVTRLYSEFMRYRKSVLYKIEHNSQYCYLEAMLNDSFDSVSRRIYITDAEVNDWSVFLWRESEDKPVMLMSGEVFMLYGEQFIGSGAIDFVVHIPRGLSFSDDKINQLHALLKYYKLAGKRYKIEEI